MVDQRYNTHLPSWRPVVVHSITALWPPLSATPARICGQEEQGLSMS